MLATDPLLLLAAAGGARPAGGAATGEIIQATAAAFVVTAALLVLGLGHRARRVPWLGRAADWASARSGLPGWAALPTGIATASLLCAVFGMYWDISLHIDVGRDPGPLANPAHYFILAGLFGIFSAGFVGMALPLERPGATAVALTRDWHAPLGATLICACGAFALIGFPLDDMWHRLFGQDVTLWGPTHLMLIGGASMTLVGIAVLVVEGRRALRGHAGPERAEHPREARWATVTNGIAGTGGFLIGLSTFQGEFDFGVPQFRFAFQPVLIMIAAGVGLVSVRLWGGRGAALGAVGFFVVVRGLLAVLVAPVLGQAVPHFPLYLVEALVVEGAALAIGTRRPVRLALVAGLGLGTLGVAAEWGWSHLWMPLPWPAAFFPEAVLLALVAALAASLVGAWVGVHLAARPREEADRGLRLGAVAGALALFAVVGFLLLKPPTDGLRAQVALTQVTPPPHRTVQGVVRLQPRDAADDAAWLTATAWQGGGLVVDRLRRVGEGVYRTTKPLPVDGDWKALIRLHTGASLMAVPVYLPDDPAIPAKGLAAPARFDRAFVPDHKVLQRESKASSGLVTLLAYLVVAGIALSLLAALAWGLHCLAEDEVRAPRLARRPRRQRADLSRWRSAAQG